jgi:uncharacterized repeat protein (TIGR02543 family)
MYFVNHSIKTNIARWFCIATAFIVAAACLPMPAFAYTLPGASPDGTHTLSEIFPGDTRDYLAEQIGYYIDQPISYKPAAETDFDDIDTVSVPSSYVKYMYGLQYCRNLENLYLSDNLISSSEMDILPELASSLMVLDLSENSIDSSGLTYLQALNLEILLLAENKISDAGLEYLPNTLQDVDLSGNNIGDAGASKIAALSNLTELNLSNNQISDVGAAALADMPNRTNLSMDLSNNHIGIEGMKKLFSAGFANLEMNGQTITLPAITNGRTPIEYIPNNIDYIVQSSISDGGKLDAAGKKIIWPARTSAAAFSYNYSYQGFTGTVYLPFKYKPFKYTVTFDDCLGNITTMTFNDLDLIDNAARPNREGYIFAGWTTAVGGDKVYDMKQPITGNLSLYARWEKINIDNNKNLWETTSTKDKIKETEHGNPRTADALHTDVLMLVIISSLVGLLLCARRFRKVASRVREKAMRDATK